MSAYVVLPHCLVMELVHAPQWRWSSPRLPSLTLAFSLPFAPPKMASPPVVTLARHQNQVLLPSPYDQHAWLPLGGSLWPGASASHHPYGCPRSRRE